MKTEIDPRYVPTKPAPAWKKCLRCGLEAPDLKQAKNVLRDERGAEYVAEGPFCPDYARCTAVLKLAMPSMYWSPPKYEVEVALKAACESPSRHEMALAIDMAVPGADRTVEVGIQNGRVVEVNELPANYVGPDGSSPL